MEVAVKDKDGGAESNTMVGIRFKPCGKIYTFDAGDISLKVGDKVVIESMFGLTIGTVARDHVEVMPSQKELKRVVRKAVDDDFKSVEDNHSFEDEAKQFCLERIEERELPMKLVLTESTLDRKRVIFYFTADGRIDFRELVKDLASKLKTRIEMRQIGVRDEAKLIGGIGVCGRELCCATFLPHFSPISIRMAKKQALSLNTSKISGLCGRLMCCLNYEYQGKAGEKAKKFKRERTTPPADRRPCEGSPKPEVKTGAEKKPKVRPNTENRPSGAVRSEKTGQSIEPLSREKSGSAPGKEELREERRGVDKAETEKPPKDKSASKQEASKDAQRHGEELKRKKRASRHKRHKRRQRRHKKG